nr:hypothetical protein B0A51_16745 [Rachicladosporium sp. CCFEE 5018]
MADVAQAMRDPSQVAYEEPHWAEDTMFRVLKVMLDHKIRIGLETSGHTCHTDQQDSEFATLLGAVVAVGYQPLAMNLAAPDILQVRDLAAANPKAFGHSMAKLRHIMIYVCCDAAKPTGTVAVSRAILARARRVSGLILRSDDRIEVENSMSMMDRVISSCRSRALEWLHVLRGAVGYTPLLRLLQTNMKILTNVELTHVVLHGPDL